ncbi:unnamed protein product [Euphydryas editha]|uniref:Uncharacterized protein n=1 Tax=Euphydryas editha TaxID=104508 RepID=A0AAU9UAC7_EUPED|nr:unnamed protein product [Euphydryas editha]
MQHKPNTKQTKDDIDSYVWLENQSERRANEIASALQHYLKKIELKCLRAKQKDLKIELYSDSCSSQNKNFVMLTIFMPSDKVFGRVEKDYRRHEVLISPKQYSTILEKHGHVIKYGEDWFTYDMKTKAKQMLKAKLPFKISQAKIIHFTLARSRAL